jgi:hypothetical protein
MPPANPTATSRLKVHYTGPFGQHDMLFHAVSLVARATLVASVRNVLTVMVGLCWNTTSFDGAEFAAAGSNLFFPETPWTPITRTSATNPAATDAPSHFTQFGARSGVDGRRAKWYLFEDTLRDTADMRFSIAESADVADVVAAFEAEATVIGSITGTTLNWYQYANVGQNDYITHRARG